MTYERLNKKFSAIFWSVRNLAWMWQQINFLRQNNIQAYDTMNAFFKLFPDLNRPLLR